MILQANGVVAGGPFGDLSGTLFDFDLLIYVFAFWPGVIIVGFGLWNPGGRLSRLSGLTLPKALRRRLNRFLRVRFAVRFLALLAFSQLLIALSDVPGSLRASHVGELALLPAVVWLPCLLTSLWPRWRSKGPVQVAHLRRLGIWDALADWEWAAVAAAYAANAVLIVWALTRAGLAAWSAAAIVLLASQALLTYAVARRVVGAPAAGSDNLELALDDVLRLQRARALVASSSFVSLWFVIGAVGDLTGIAMFQSKVIFFPLIVAMSFGSAVWNHSTAHRNWQRAWPAETPPPHIGRDRLRS